MPSINTIAPLSSKNIRDAIEQVIDEDPFYGRMVADAAERRYLLDAIESLPLPAPVANHVAVTQACYPGFYKHMLAASWVMVGLSCDRLSLKYDIGQAAAAGLLHDLAMLHLDCRLMDPSIQLDDALRQQLYRHPQMSKALLERHHCYDNEMLVAIVEHHEAMDGSGYPRHLAGAAISPMGQRLAITEVVTAFLGDRPDGGELRLGVLLRMNLHRYERTLIDRVLALLNPALDSRSAHVRVIERPIDVLIRIAEHIDQWMRQQPGLSAIGTDGARLVQRMTVQLAQLQRNLAEAGLTQAQLADIGHVAGDELLSRELSQLALEANWQLHAIAQWARRIWPAAKAGQPPPLWRSWIEETTQLTEPLLTRYASK